METETLVTRWGDKLRDYLQRWIVKKGKDKCWLWTGHRMNLKGKILYPIVDIQGQRYMVRRLVYLLSGRLPALGEHTVTSTCKNSMCCNPAHLERGKAFKAGRKGYWG